MTDDTKGTSVIVGLLFGVMFAALIVWKGIVSDVIRHRRSKTAMAIAWKLAASDEPSVPYSRLGLPQGSEERVLRELLSKRFLANVLLDPDARALVIPGVEKAASVSYSCPTCGGASNIDPAKDQECPYCGVAIEKMNLESRAASCRPPYCAIWTRAWRGGLRGGAWPLGAGVQSERGGERDSAGEGEAPDREWTEEALMMAALGLLQRR